MRRKVETQHRQADAPSRVLREVEGEVEPAFATRRGGGHVTAMRLRPPSSARVTTPKGQGAIGPTPSDAPDPGRRIVADVLAGAPTLSGMRGLAVVRSRPSGRPSWSESVGNVNLALGHRHRGCKAAGCGILEPRRQSEVQQAL
jgi:hypothetical protein